jgi:hypothetical protein
MAKAFAPDFGQSDLNTAFIADDTAVFHPLVLAAETLPVRNGTENARAEEAILLRFESPVVDGFRFRHFAMRPRANLFRGSQTDPDAVKIGD